VARQDRATGGTAEQGSQRIKSGPQGGYQERVVVHGAHRGCAGVGPWRPGMLPCWVGRVLIATFRFFINDRSAVLPQPHGGCQERRYDRR
jgi:hypothetical protein